MVPWRQSDLKKCSGAGILPALAGRSFHGSARHRQGHAGWKPAPLFLTGGQLPFFSSGEIVEIPHELFLHFLAGHGGVNQAMFEQEFSGLKTGREFGMGWCP